MSKRDLRKYLNELTKDQLEEQVLDLYIRFKPVKTYYNFVFKPNEEKLLEEAKFKISKEYFPLTARKPKARRSIAHKIIKHFIQLGVDSYITAEVMIYNIEVAQKYTQQKEVKQLAFYNGMLKSYQEVVEFTKDRNLTSSFMPRLINVVTESEKQKWMNSEGFENTLNNFHP